MSDILHVISGGPPKNWYEYQVQKDGVDIQGCTECDVLGMWAIINGSKVYGNFSIKHAPRRYVDGTDTRAPQNVYGEDQGGFAPSAAPPQQHPDAHGMWGKITSDDDPGDAQPFVMPVFFQPKDLTVGITAAIAQLSDTNDIMDQMPFEVTGTCEAHFELTPELQDWLDGYYHDFYGDDE